MYVGTVAGVAGVDVYEDRSEPPQPSLVEDAPEILMLRARRSHASSVIGRPNRTIFLSASNSRISPSVSHHSDSSESSWPPQSQLVLVWQLQLSLYVTVPNSNTMTFLTPILGTSSSRCNEKKSWRNKRAGQGILQRRIRESDEQERGCSDLRSLVSAIPMAQSSAC